MLNAEIASFDRDDKIVTISRDYPNRDDYTVSMCKSGTDNVVILHHADAEGIIKYLSHMLHQAEYTISELKG